MKRPMYMTSPSPAPPTRPPSSSTTDDTRSNDDVTRLLMKRLKLDIESDGIISVTDLRKRCLIRHPEDRPKRQRGGERKALSTLNTFLLKRGEGFSEGISSPLSSWTSCSRLRYIYRASLQLLY